MFCRSIVNKNCYKKGFTLVELLVTTSIVSILAGLAVAQFKEYSQLSYEGRAYAQLKSAHTAIVAYYIDNPDDSNNSTSIHYATNGVILGNPNALPGFVHDADARVAIVAVLRGNDTGWWVQKGGSFDIGAVSCLGKTYGTSGGLPLKKRWVYWSLPVLDMQSEYTLSQALNCDNPQMIIG